MSPTEDNSAPASPKAAAISFLRLAATGKVREAYQKHVAPNFRHHNPFFRGDAESLLIAMEENAAKNPNKVLEIQRALEDGELVAVHSRVRPKPGDLGVAVVHIFKFQGNRIVELWDLGQPVPENSPNENGMF
jgi:predicted SnoaL-like aldol condensation-catalyzing enzyme